MIEGEIREVLSNSSLVTERIFQVLQAISVLVNDPGTLKVGRELVIRSLAVKDHIGPQYLPLLDSLVRAVGLFPYADLSLTDSIEDQVVVEAHRAPNLASNNIFHRLQLDVFRELINGRNVVLSATTSVGKNRVVDALLASERHRKTVIIVPTIALIDETRRRLTELFGHSHDIITHPSQQAFLDGRPAVYILTQERALARDDLTQVDFVVVDEFYKLDIRGEYDERAIDLNLCFHRFAEAGAQFYLIGPHIGSVTGLPEKYKHTFIPSDFATVALNVKIYNLKKNDIEARNKKLVQVCGKLETPTLVYCQSPQKAREAAEVLILGLELDVAEGTKDAVEWLELHYPTEWIVIEALRRGIGIHHGNVPRALQQYMVKAFEDKKIQFLVCTSTIIEGVNTVAENVIIYDRRINNTNIDYFTFRNIAGRAGRMNRYFIGHVFVLEQPPSEDLRTVELPIEHQTETTPMSLILDLPETDLVDISRERLRNAFLNSPLPEGILRANRYVAIDDQNRLYDHIATNYTSLRKLLDWNGPPKPEQLKTVCNLIYEFIDHGNHLRSHKVFSGDALYAELVALRVAKSHRDYINERVKSRLVDESVTDSVERVLKFLRNYIGHTFGRQLMAVSRIQAEAMNKRFPEHKGDYSYFAAQAESLFMASGLHALDEYGVPLELARKLAKPGNDYETLDSALRLIAEINLSQPNLHPFERQLLKDIQSSLPSRAYL